MAAPRKKFDPKRKRNTQSLLFKRKRFCRFTVAGVEQVDYKDTDTLRDFIAENGRHRCRESDTPSAVPSDVERTQLVELRIHCIAQHAREHFVHLLLKHSPPGKDMRVEKLVV